MPQTKPHASTAAQYVPEKRTLPALKAVFGEGTSRAPLALIGDRRKLREEELIVELATARRRLS